MHRQRHPLKRCSTSLASGNQVDFHDTYTEGITKLTKEDFLYAKKMKCAIKLLAVSKTLRDAAPIPLTVKQTQGDVLSLKGHLVFDYEFIQACVDNETIYEIADKYAAEARMRGDKDSANKVRLDTKMVAAGQTCTFEIPSCSGTSQIGCVAEVNRSFSWKIKTIGYQSKSEREYKCNDSVRKGLPFRKEKVSSDERYKIIVSITNKSKRDGSFALILF